MPSPVPDGALRAPELLQSVEQVLPIEQIFPTQAVLLGGAVLVGVTLFHGFVMRWVQSHTSSRVDVLRRAPSTWRIDLVMTTVVMALLGAALGEVALWTAALKYGRVFSTWVSAVSYAGSSYTTLGNTNAVPPPGWGIMGPIIAISGLFTFGWSGSVLVTVVGRLGLLRELHRGAPPTEPTPPAT